MNRIVANKLYAPPILVHLPEDIQHVVYSFMYDDVKVAYWLKKYNWKRAFHEMRNSVCGDGYGILYHIDMYYKHMIQPGKLCSKSDFYYEYDCRRDKDKYYDGAGRLTRVVHSWTDEYCDDKKVFQKFTQMLYDQFKEKRDVLGLYKYLAAVNIEYMGI